MSIHYGKVTDPALCGEVPTPQAKGVKRAELAERNVKAWHLVNCGGCLVHRPAPMETGELISGLQRMIRALEARCIDDPQWLAEVILLAQRLSEVTDVAIASNMAKRDAVPRSQRPFVGPSGDELGALLGIKPQSITDRRKRGDQVLFERATGQDTMTRRDRLAATKARKHAEAALADFLGRRESV